MDLSWAAMSLQERADRAAQELVKACAEMSGPQDGEMVVIVRGTIDGCTVQDGLAGSDLLWTWDWFKRPKTVKLENDVSVPGSVP